MHVTKYRGESRDSKVGVHNQRYTCIAIQNVMHIGSFLEGYLNLAWSHK